MLLLLRLTNFHSSRILFAMPATRSRSKAVGGGVAQPVQKPPKSRGRRETSSNEVVEFSDENRKKSSARKLPVSATSSLPVGTSAVPDHAGPPPTFVPADLSFSFEEAKQHLISADSRFQDVFDTAVCTPYQRLDQVEPFRCVLLLDQGLGLLKDQCVRRTLCTSIL